MLILTWVPKPRGSPETLLYRYLPGPLSPRASRGNYLDISWVSKPQGPSERNYIDIYLGSRGIPAGSRGVPVGSRGVPFPHPRAPQKRNYIDIYTGP